MRIIYNSNTYKHFILDIEHGLNEGSAALAVFEARCNIGVIEQ